MILSDLHRNPVPTGGGVSNIAETMPSAPIVVCGEELTGLACGALWRESDRLLVVADLHLEKGSSFARRGQMLPPYDTAATLAALSLLVFGYDPITVVALGDSFHDNDGPNRLSSYDLSAIRALQRGREWIWVAGNHDDDLPPQVGGERTDTVAFGPLVLRHEPELEGGQAGEIAGHFHPAARVVGRGGSVRRRCFASDGQRLIMPAFGAYTGGLNILEPVVASLFAAPLIAFVLGGEGVYKVRRSRLRAD
ncbi:MAG: ligase-associated DNA damage response endonuclease PdeM [Alphaproteobacteria bacterium]